MIKIKINSSINERLSDISYGKITNYFYEMLKDPKDFAVGATDYTYDDPHLGKQVIPSARIHSFSPADWRDEYKKYRSFTGDEGTIIKSIDHYIQMMKDLKIFILPSKVRPEAGGDMNANGTMRIFLPNWKAPSINYEEFHKKLTNYYINIEPDKKPSYMDTVSAIYNDYTVETLQKVLDGINAGRFANFIRDVLSHEIAHYINAVRSSGESVGAASRKVFRASGGKRGKYKQFKIDQPEYAKSTEEWQARFSESLHNLESVYDMKFPNIDSDLAEYNEAYERDNDERASQIKNYYKQLLKSSGFPQKGFQLVWDLKHHDFMPFFNSVVGYNREYFKKMDEKKVNRVKTRVYSIYNDYKKRFENHPLYKVFEITLFPSW